MDHLMTTDQLADALGLRPQTLREWRSEARGPAFVKIGRAVRYRVEDVEDYLNGARVESRAA